MAGFNKNCIYYLFMAGFNKNYSWYYKNEKKVMNGALFEERADT